jgi:hypothetical protein
MQGASFLFDGRRKPAAIPTTQQGCENYAKPVQNPAVLALPNGTTSFLAFMTIWALLGIEFLRRHAKDVVALDAHFVEYFGAFSVC